MAEQPPKKQCWTPSSDPDADALARLRLGEKITEAESQLALGQLHLETRDVKGAESIARSAAMAFHKASSSDDEALSYCLLASALLAQGKPTEAQQAAERANELLPKVLDLAARIEGEMNTAYVTGMVDSPAGSAHTDASKPARAVSALEAALEKASRFGYVGPELEARLRLGKLELQSGHASAGRMRLEGLQQDARAEGFHFIAHRASDELRAHSSPH